MMKMIEMNSVDVNHVNEDELKCRYYFSVFVFLLFVFSNLVKVFNLVITINKLIFDYL